MEPEKTDTPEEAAPEEAVAVPPTAEPIAPVLAQSRRYPELAFLLGWLMPGAGHLYAGQRKKALIFFLALFIGYIFGALISSFECLSWNYHNFAFIAQIGMGGLTLPIVIIKHNFGLEPADFKTVNTLMDPGLLYTQVAGLLNLLVAFDAYEVTAILRKK